MRRIDTLVSAAEAEHGDDPLKQLLGSSESLRRQAWSVDAGGNNLFSVD